MLYANLCDNGRFALPGGLPCRLGPEGETVVTGVLPRGSLGVSVTIRADAGVTPTGAGGVTANAPTSATVHLALFDQPPGIGILYDGEIVGNEVAATVTTTEQTLSVATPTTGQPAVYCFRLWIDGLTGTNGASITALGSL